mmetsp:Transcript_1530/g.4078  ORF Transcript_1530/g.4078 Transcript_1530/m.4078 type:complete len:199 (-) Transcript_1530:60-656(-)
MRKRAENVEKKAREDLKKRGTDIPSKPAALEQLKLDSAEGAFDDYFELTRQFGQVGIFAAAFPLGSVIAAMNNQMEVYSDCFKRCKLMHRPLPHRALHIGSWLQAFDMIAMLSVMSNLGIITFTARYIDDVVGHQRDSTTLLLSMILIEHFIFLLRVFATRLIPQIPRWIQLERARAKYLDDISSHKTSVTDVSHASE